MPYSINRTSGLKIATIQDGTVDVNSLDITLVGKNYTGYGEAFNENFVKLLENFANSTKPTKPLTGQLWYDSSSRVIKLYTGVGSEPWKSVGILESSNSKPVGHNAGDLWFNKEEGRLYAYSGVGTSWILVGPLTTRSSASGAIESTVLRSTAGSDVVLKIISNGIETAIVSAVNVDVNSTDPSYTAFPKLKKGITLPDMLDTTHGVSYRPATGGNILWGTAATALGLVRTNGDYVSADDYLKTTELASLNNTINVGVDDGILIGSQGVMKLHVTGNTGNISILPQGSAPQFKLNIGGTSVNVLTVNTGTQNNFNILPSSSFTSFLGTNSQRFSFGFINTLTSQSISASSISATSVAGTTVTDNSNRVLTSVTVTAGTGMSGGGTVSGPTGSVTVNNAGVLSLTGTSNQVSVSAATGNITLSLPQSIDTNATVTFNRVNATSIYGGAVYDGGNRVLTSASVSGSAVSSIAGTTNQVIVSSNVGAVTLSLPQNIHTGASPTFSSITVGTLAGAGGAGNISGSWSLGSGASFQATYADLAERYAADAEYEPGTVLVIGGTAEVTTTTRHGDTARAGIVSTDPAYTLNAEAGSNLTHPYIALAGRVPCKVKGFIRKGELLVTSTEAGYAEAAHANDHPNAVLARALEDFEGTFGIIEVMVV